MRRLFSVVTHYLNIYKKYLGNRLYIVFGLTLLASATEGLGIAMLLPLVLLLDVSTGQSAETVQEVSGIELLLQEILVFLGINESIVGILVFITLIFVLKGVLKFAEQAYKFYLQAELMRETRSSLFDKYSNMTYQYYNKHNAGHFINLINVQIDRLIQSFEFYNRFLSAAITTLSYFVFAFLISWQFASMSVFAGLLMLMVFRRLNSYVRMLSRKTAAESGVLNHLIVQSMQSFKYIASTAQMAPLRDQVIPSIYRLTGYQMRTGIASAITLAVREPLAVIVLVSIIVVQIVVLELPIAPIMVSLLLIYRAIGYVINIQSSWQQTMSFVGSLEAVEDEFDRIRLHQQSNGGQVVPPLSQEIELQDVSFAYDESDIVLDHISITIPANSIVAFVGESGAGKSTLIDMLTLMLRPTHGRIVIDGLSHDKVNLESWRRQIGYVSQDTVIFDDTVANNICMWQGEYDADEELRNRIEIAATRAYAKEFIDALPDGFNTRVGDRGVRLSGGQRQRLFIARELFKNPRLLILDEATSALDSDSELIIKESIDALKGQMTVVIIAHRLSTIRAADHIYLLEHGKIVEEGTYESLTATEGSFKRIASLQRV